MSAVTATLLQQQRVYLHPGQMAAAANRCVVSTILGSCVAVSLHDPQLGIGGINHFLLPHAPKGEASPRYGDVALPRLLLALLRLGANRDRLVAKVVGGACVLEVFRDRSAHLGQQNADVALELLHALDIPVVFQQTGGQRGRRVVFHPHSGDLLVRSL